MKSNLTKADVCWIYFVKAFTLLSGMITLPLILNRLTSEEIAVNYLFLNIISYTFIFDMGFSIQFSRNVAFAFGGAADIRKTGYETRTEKETLNYQLIKNIISAAQFLYIRIAFVLLLFLLFFGSWYVCSMTNDYKIGNNIILLWCLFSFFISIDFYYKFFSTLLQGKGAITDLNRIEFVSSLVKLLVTVLFLLLGWRLWAILFGMIAKIILCRTMSVYVLYYKDGLIDNLKNLSVFKSDKVGIIKKLWYNAKKSAFVQLSTFFNTQFGFLLAGLYLMPEEVSAYGLLMQLTSIIYAVALSLSSSASPIYSQLRAAGNMDGIKNLFFFTTGMFYVVYGVGSFLLLFGIPFALTYIKSNVFLPSLLVTIVYLLNKFLEGQHCACIFCLSSKNKIYDMESAIIMAIATIILLLFMMFFFHSGLFGIVLVQFSVALVYANWKWPYELCKDFRISYCKMVYYSLDKVKDRIITSLVKS